MIIFKSLEFVERKRIKGADRKNGNIFDYCVVLYRPSLSLDVYIHTIS